MAQKKQKKMTREEAMQLYQDLQDSVNAIVKGKVPPKAAKPGPAANTISADRIPLNVELAPRTRDRGAVAAVTFVLFCAMVKVGVSVIEYTGIFDAVPAHATMAQGNEIQSMSYRMVPGSGLSTEEIKILTSLDGRRIELDERGKTLQQREEDLNRRDKDYVLKLTELRELTDKLKIEREKDARKQSGELDQLAAVYGAMAPQDAAQLIEQLDVTIALPLLKRMPEKRMGQILPLMSPERALAITRLLSGAREQ